MPDFLFDIESVRDREDPAVAYRYNVVIPIPSEDNLIIDPMYVEDIQFQLPYHTQDTLIYNSTVINYAGRFTAPSLTIRFYETYRHTISQLMEAWMSIIRNQNGTMNYGSEYKRNISVIVFDSTGKDVVYYDFIGCFPLEPSPIQLSYSRSERTTFTQSFSADRVAKVFRNN
jgi:hypothetical protein